MWTPAALLRGDAGSVWEQLPTNPVRQFQLVYCLWLAAALLLHRRRHGRFYDWFFSSGVALAQKRGLGAHPNKLYGVITPPTLTPRQLRLTGAALAAMLLMSCTPLAPRFFLFCGAMLTFMYFPQLFAEATLSGHSTILIPSILLLLSCSPSLDHEVQSASVWPLQLIRLYLASGYFSSGLCKLLCGLLFKRFWGNGSTLQFYVFEGMWSRPSISPTIQRLQRELITRPRLATLFACGAVAFECGFVAAPFSPTLAPIFGVNGFAFHGGILALQGLDFVTFWSPALFAFIIPLPVGEAGIVGILRAGWQLEPFFFIPAALYVTLQVLVAASLYDLWLDDVLPLSCCPMFMPPRNPYDTLPKWWTMTDAPLNGSTRKSGSMEPLYWSPISSTFEMTVEDAKLLPQRVVWFGSSTGCPKEVAKFVKPEYREKPFLLFSNFELSPELKHLLHRVIEHVSMGSLADAYDHEKVSTLLQLQQECLECFDACVAAARAKEAPESACAAVPLKLD